MAASSGAPIPLEGWQGSTGIGGSFQAESVATFAWNRWQVSTGISGNLRAEYADQTVQRSHPPPFTQFLSRQSPLTPRDDLAERCPDTGRQHVVIEKTVREGRDRFPDCAISPMWLRRQPKGR